MFSRRKVMMDNLLPVVTSMIVASVGGLFGTAAFVRLIQVGGSRIGSHLLRISLLSRNVTTPLAIAITNILGGEISIAAAVVVLTGIFGATFGARILTAWNVNDSVSRGLSIGAAAQGLGVASFINEKDAFPFAAISMVLTAVAATTLVSIPMIKSALLTIAGGN
jgi:putative effector of murein hydrolase